MKRDAKIELIRTRLLMEVQRVEHLPLTHLDKALQPGLKRAITMLDRIVEETK
jgi:hypothetical protein